MVRQISGPYLDPGSRINVRDDDDYSDIMISPPKNDLHMSKAVHIGESVYTDETISVSSGGLSDAYSSLTELSHRGNKHHEHLFSDVAQQNMDEGDSSNRSATHGKLCVLQKGSLPALDQPQGFISEEQGIEREREIICQERAKCLKGQAERTHRPRRRDISLPSKKFSYDDDSEKENHKFDKVELVFTPRRPSEQLISSIWKRTFHRTFSAPPKHVQNLLATEIAEDNIESLQKDQGDILAFKHSNWLAQEDSEESLTGYDTDERRRRRRHRRKKRQQELLKILEPQSEQSQHREQLYETSELPSRSNSPTPTIGGDSFEMRIRSSQESPKSSLPYPSNSDTTIKSLLEDEEEEEEEEGDNDEQFYISEQDLRTQIEIEVRKMMEEGEPRKIVSRRKIRTKQHRILLPRLEVDSGYTTSEFDQNESDFERHRSLVPVGSNIYKRSSKQYEDEVTYHSPSSLPIDMNLEGEVLDRLGVNSKEERGRRGYSHMKGTSTKERERNRQRNRPQELQQSRVPKQKRALETLVLVGNKGSEKLKRPVHSRVKNAALGRTVPTIRKKRTILPGTVLSRNSSISGFKKKSISLKLARHEETIISDSTCISNKDKDPLASAIHKSGSYRGKYMNMSYATAILNKMLFGPKVVTRQLSIRSPRAVTGIRESLSKLLISRSLDREYSFESDNNSACSLSSSQTPTLPAPPRATCWHISDRLLELVNHNPILTILAIPMNFTSFVMTLILFPPLSNQLNPDDSRMAQKKALKATIMDLTVLAEALIMIWLLYKILLVVTWIYNFLKMLCYPVAALFDFYSENYATRRR
ncbi:hypothetical protein V1511DRAFT_29372 [Dipodascopsis uninucleata]